MKDRRSLTVDKILIAIVVIGFMFFVILSSGCAGTVKTQSTQTVTTLDVNNQPVTVVTETEIEKPKDIAYSEQVAAKHSGCVIPQPTGQSVSLGLSSVRFSDLKSGAAQIEYMDAIVVTQLTEANKAMAMALSGSPEAACHEAIAKEATAYYALEAKRSSNRWGFGKFLAGIGIAYLAVDAWTDSIAQGGATYYTTNMGNRSVGDATSGGAGTGGGSISASGDSTFSDITINNGMNASDRAMNANYTDKAIGVPLNGDSNFDQVDNGSKGGIIIDDPDGGNSGSLF